MHPQCPPFFHLISGSFGADIIRTEFCMKNRTTESTYDMDWPQGTYCVLKNGDCPSGKQHYDECRML